MGRAAAALSLALATACAVGAEDDGEDRADAPFSLPADARDEDRIDAVPRPDSLPGADAPSEATGETDTCAEARDLTALAMTAGGATVTGDTTLYVDDARPAATGCTGFEPDGPDAFYEVTVASGKQIRATVQAAWDVSIYVLASCADDTTCRAGIDAVAGAGDEALTWRVNAAGTYTVVVDGWNPGAAGPFTLTVRVTD